MYAIEFTYSVLNQNFKLGWEDSDTLEKNSVKNLHSSWSLDEFKESLLEPYIKEAFLKSKKL